MIISTIAYSLMSGDHSLFPADFPIRTRWESIVPTDWAGLLETEPGRGVYPSDAPYIAVPATYWDVNYGGDDVTRSNHRSILRDHVDGTFIDGGGYGEHELRIPLWIDADEHDADRSIHLNAEAAEDFIRTMVGLAYEYPLYDESDHSELIEELISESWDAYLGADVTGIVEAHGEGPDDALWTGAAIRDAFWALYWADRETDDLYPEAETATSVIIPEWESAARALARGITDGTIKPSRTAA